MKEIAEENICPACFRPDFLGGRCPHCGYCLNEELVHPLALPHFSMLSRVYRTGRVLGVGGFGITYAAQNVDTGLLCCIKEYVPSDLSCVREENGALIIPEVEKEEFSRGRQRFLDEARILQELRENITVVNIWSFFEQNNTAYFVMEYLSGSNMRVYQQKNIEDKKAIKDISLRMLLYVGNALIEVHGFGLIHGDISPENIIVTESGDIKLIDFGAARLYTRSDAQQGGKIFLKSGYAPYEQHIAGGRIGPWTDIYSLAATFYAVMTGKKVPDARERIRKDIFCPLSQMEIGLEKEIASVIDAALTVDYRERYQSMNDFMGALGEALKKTESVVRVEEPLETKRIVNKTEAISGGASNESFEYQEKKAEKHRSWFSRKKTGRKRVQRIYLEMYTRSGEIRSWAFPVNGTVLVGRLPSCQIVLPPDERLSRRHCIIRHVSKNNVFLITDCSSFGTYLGNGVRLPKGVDYKIRFGEYFYMSVPEFRFRLVEDSI